MYRIAIARQRYQLEKRVVENETKKFQWLLGGNISFPQYAILPDKGLPAGEMEVSLFYKCFFTCDGLNLCILLQNAVKVYMWGDEREQWLLIDDLVFSGAEDAGSDLNASHVYIKILEMLHAADTTVPEEKNRLLEEAFRCGYLSVVRRLVQAGMSFDIEAQNKEYETRLHQAVKKQHRHIAAFLLDKGANVNTKTSFFERTPVHDAVKNGDIGMLELLIRYDANCDVKTALYETPLHYSVQVQRPDLVKALLSRQVNCNQCSQRFPRGEFGLDSTDHGAAPLHLAVHLRNYEITEMILASGTADTEITTWGFNDTALKKVLRAADCNSVVAIQLAALLLSYNARLSWLHDEAIAINRYPRMLVLLQLSVQLQSVGQRLDNLLDGRLRSSELDEKKMVCSLHALVGQSIWRSVYKRYGVHALRFIYKECLENDKLLPLPPAKIRFLQFGKYAPSGRV